MMRIGLLVIGAVVALYGCGGADDSSGAGDDRDRTGIGAAGAGAGGSGAGGSGGAGGEGGSLEPECTWDEDCGECAFCESGACRSGCNSDAACEWNDAEMQMMCCVTATNPATGTDYTTCIPPR